jgi:RNA recognition motif-containing protein
MNIFVGNLTINVTEENLQDIFSKYGKIKAIKIIKDIFTGKSKGFAFVEMYSENEGQKAITELNLTELDGKKIMINKAKPEADKRTRRPGGGFQKRR